MACGGIISYMPRRKKRREASTPDNSFINMHTTTIDYWPFPWHGAICRVCHHSSGCVPRGQHISFRHHLWLATRNTAVLLERDPLGCLGHKKWCVPKRRVTNARYLTSDVDPRTHEWIALWTSTGGSNATRILVTGFLGIRPPGVRSVFSQKLQWQTPPTINKYLLLIIGIETKNVEACWKESFNIFE